MDMNTNFCLNDAHITIFKGMQHEFHALLSGNRKEKSPPEHSNPFILCPDSN